ncbi:MAG: Hsp20/alpha crystallin family protein [Pirellulales bacterium]|nr:Hsp20/alpha crystallin family protein [Pirellulales bacterium]
MTTSTKQASENTTATESTHSGPVFRPNVDIIEREDQLVLYADMPGVPEDAIDINFQEGTLTINGKAAPRQPEGTEYSLNEYGVGGFHRTFRVSEKIDAAKISADYRDGVLILNLPKAESHKPRKIAVNVN